MWYFSLEPFQSDFQHLFWCSIFKAKIILSKIRCLQRWIATNDWRSALGHIYKNLININLIYYWQLIAVHLELKRKMPKKLFHRMERFKRYDGNELNNLYVVVWKDSMTRAIDHDGFHNHMHDIEKIKRNLFEIYWINLFMKINTILNWMLLYLFSVFFGFLGLGFLRFEVWKCLHCFLAAYQEIKCFPNTIMNWSLKGNFIGKCGFH